MRSSISRKRLFLAGVLAVIPAIVALGSGCSEDSTDPFRPADTTPPAPSILSIDGISADTSNAALLVISFTWRAPGDDGTSGTASKYDLRYARFPVDESNWDDATIVSGMDEPQTPPARERVDIEGLAPDTTYYFAIRTRDDASNWSPLSPVFNVTMPSQTGLPVLWGGRQLRTDGTDQTAYLYQVNVLSLGGLPSRSPSVLIDDGTFSMTFKDTLPGMSWKYEADLRLSPGTHTYSFRLTFGGFESLLPNPGTWIGPKVSATEIFAQDSVFAPADSFMMGVSTLGAPQIEQPQHEVVLTVPFYIDRYEVTNAQICAAFNEAYLQGLITVTDDTLVTMADTGIRLLLAAPHEDGTPHGIQFANDTHFTPMPFRENWPATYITWFGAAAYCNFRSAADSLDAAYDTRTWNSIPAFRPYESSGWRLPTEAEWEYVAQYNDGRLYPSGNDVPQPGVHGNFSNVTGHPTPVGEYPGGETSLGLFDLMGNVWEWCYDRKSFYSEDRAVDPVGPRVGGSKIVRGGSWGSSADELRCAHRFSIRPEKGYDGLGFRCVRSVPEPIQ
ncbi:SUMF1/EgtB/PvdO family nonheme iron enzyme [Candidatus Eisenbacteria bacterium]|uniref:SUMF1/EgtB/PvdO family nonheme iron enzyme n=1 Tax=Eiseniibacteriota bacterium TaxID=2212470 RepID=A0ABV6YI26_UNCEI